MLRFIHCADIHLDSPLRGLERYEGAPVDEIRSATRGALEALVGTAIAEHVDFVIIAGDVYDGDWRDYNTGLFFAKQMSLLRKADIRVFVISGNHDAASQISRQLQLPENVHCFSTTTPETVVFDAGAGETCVAIHGQGFATAKMPTDLSLAYPAPLPGHLNIGVLHTSADGREGHQVYAPTSVSALVSKGYDYWALGHVHQREILSKDPWILFPGNLQGRHIRETGAKGCTLVSVRGGMIESVEHVAVDVLRWSVCEVDASCAESLDEVLREFELALQSAVANAEGRLAALRVRVQLSPKLHGQSAAHAEHWTQQVRALATDMAAGSAWVEKVEWRAANEEEDSALESAIVDEALHELLDLFSELEADPEGCRRFLDVELDELRRRLPPEVFEGPDGLDVVSSGAVRRLWSDVRSLLLPQLIGADENSS